MEMLVRANPDGYTIGYGNTPLLAINKSLLPNWPYEAGRDLQPVARLTNSQNLPWQHARRIHRPHQKRNREMGGSREAFGREGGLKAGLRTEDSGFGKV